MANTRQHHRLVVYMHAFPRAVSGTHARDSSLFRDKILTVRRIVRRSARRSARRSGRRAVTRTDWTYSNICTSGWNCKPYIFLAMFAIAACSELSDDSTSTNP
ncbi:unnamed protein product [Ectocarpus sp. 12 AP-2014]